MYRVCASALARSTVFTGLVLLIGAVLQAGVIAAAASFLANLDKHHLALRQRLDEVDAHLSHHKVDPQLKKKVSSFFEYMFHCGHHTNEEELLDGLSEKLRMQLLLARMRNIVEKAAVFRRLSSPCTLALVDLLAPVVVLPREYVLVQGSVGIARGLVQWPPYCRGGRWVNGCRGGTINPSVGAPQLDPCA